MTEATLENVPTYKSFEGIVASALTYEEWLKLFKKHLAELLGDDKVCDGCGFFDHCEDEPYDCNAMDALRKIAGKEAT